MIANQKNTGRAWSMAAGLAYGGLVCLVLTIAFTIILSKLVAAEVIRFSQIGYGVMIILLSASFLGSIASYKKIKRRRLAVCMLSGLIYMGILLSITALFFGGQYEAVGITGLLVLCGSVTAGLLGAYQKKGRKTPKAIRRSC